MNEVLKPIYDDVVKILKGEKYGQINTGTSEVFNDVSKELIGYKCFGDTIYQALLFKLEDRVISLEQQGIIKQEEICLECGFPDRVEDVALNLSFLLFPCVFDLRHSKDGFIYQSIDSLYAFLPCNDYDVVNLFDTLGPTFKKKYEEVVLYPPKTTEDLYNILMTKVGAPF